MYTNQIMEEFYNTECYGNMRGASGVANGLSYVISERTKDGGVISVSNDGTVDRSVSFSIYAKIV